MDTLLLSRMQFALNISFHILFPVISIALGWVLLFFRWRYLRTRNAAWLAAYELWVKVFALTFALGVVTGIVMSFQFGTNWPGFMLRVGNIAGPLLGYEVLSAFFLEATFLGVMLYGRERVSDRVHLMASFLVAFGTTLSAFWILSLNSWLHTPTGYRIVDGVFFVDSWWAVIFNPSFPWRFTHMLLASFLTVAFLLAGMSAWQMLRQRSHLATLPVLRFALYLAALLVPLQILVGDLHGLNTLKHQPQKIAAIEGVWHTERGAPLLLAAWPNEATRTHDWEIGIPKLASLILLHDANGEIRGLNEFPNAHPPVKPLFFGFRLMVGIGLSMLALAWAGIWLLRHGTPPRWLLRGLVGMTFSGWVATLAGWYVTEIGRQPWMVNGLVRTAELVAQQPVHNVAISFAAYVVVYALLLVAYIRVLYYLIGKNGKITEASTS